MGYNSGGSKGVGGVWGWVVGVITPLVAENLVCSNSNFSPTGAITPPPPLAVLPGRHPHPPPPSENPVSAPV